MKRPQWITAGITFLLVIIIFLATKSQFFGERKAKSLSSQPVANQSELTVDSILYYSKQSLPKESVEKLNTLENSITRGDVASQKLHLYHQLASFWRDTARVFPPYAYYTAEAARLENSEKSLTFAAHLLLDNLTNEENPRLKNWEALQAKDLFERSLKLNPGNDSSKIGLGAVYLYGGISQPMEGIGMIREAVERDSANIYGQMTLAKASLFSGQLEKAIERFKKIVSLQPQNIEAILLMADTYERMNNKAEAIKWYEKSIPLMPEPRYKKEIAERITQLKK